jgi:hypothetical protein
MAQRTFRGTGWIAAAGGLVLAAGALAGISGVVAHATPTGPQVVRVHLTYGCRFPAGLRQASVTVSGAFPAAGVVGQPVQPTGLHVALALPHAVVTDLNRLGAARVTGSDLLTATVAESTNATTARWPGTVPRPVRLPTTGNLRLLTSGPIPSFSVKTPGSVTLTASRLSLTFAPQKASGTATNLATLQAACALKPGQNAMLATIPIATAGPSPTATAAPRRASAAPHGGKVPQGCNSIRIKAPQIACGYVTGYANVNKLKGAALLQPPAPQKPGLASIAINVRIKSIPGAVLFFNIGRLYYRGLKELPPVQTTFLGFGFVPITATLEVAELEPISIVVKLYRTVLVKVTATTKVSFRVFNATVNGVPWNNLGTHCQTKTPIELKLVGRGNTSNGGSGFWDLQKGGTLGGTVTVPPFVHCGVGEDLNPLLTASISGPRNFDLMTQGPLCFSRPFVASTCPPKVPKPRRHLDVGKP